ncbi:MAG: metal-dependent transcriptional regulator [Holosporaceae bacterium]|jgi:DtxR family Mn-dependent transcriptional regulator|nr:metal-dependent transcriptional regulator [Holosporaceae bacterium]
MTEITPNQENYLKTIYLEVEEKGYAKMSDVAALLSVRKSSVNAALNILADKKLINYTPYAKITLTEIGLKKAREIIKRFETMNNFFLHILKLSREEAIANSCKIEHVMSEALFDRISEFYEFTEEFCKQNPDYKKQLDSLLVK